VDAATGQPINGSAFVWIEYPDGTPLNLLQAAADGSFQSVNLVLSQTSFALVFDAIGSNGTAYVPAVLTPTSSCDITQGTFIGTMALSSGMSATVSGTAAAITSQNQPAIVNVEPTLFEQANGMNWGIPWLSTYLPKATLSASASCPANTACATFQTVVSAEAPQLATYAGSGTQFAASPGGASYSMQFTWAPSVQYFGHCTQPFITLGPLPVSPAATVDFGTATFTGC
jgi:hypothetical protein